MTEREALLAAIAANPDDDLPRLVLADWLDEHGEPKRADFVRLQVELARPSDCPACGGTGRTPGEFEPEADCPACPRPALLAREAGAVERDWRALLDPADRDTFELMVSRPLFSRGLLDGVRLAWGGGFGTGADDWHRACDLAARRPLVARVEAPGCFEVLLLPGADGPGWVAEVADDGASCPTCHGGGVVARFQPARFAPRPACAGGRRGFTFAAPTRERLTDHTLRWEVGRAVFGDGHPLFQTAGPG